MSEPIIKVDGLSKKYRIGLKENMNDSLAGMITDVIKAPFRNFKRIRNLTKFGDNTNEDDIIWALKDVSFEVKQGEVLGVIGKNGAGKSTLLKILSRITKPTSGEAIINGRIASLLEVGTGFHSELTGRENTFLNGTILGMSKKEIARKFDEIVDFSGVEKFIDTPIKRYSSGMTVRLAFAVAAHLEPEILVIDEVLAVGDAEFQKKAIGKMKSIAEERGRTIMFVSHNMGAVSSLCSKVVFLKNGRVADYGPTDEIIKTYLLDSVDNKGEVMFNDEFTSPEITLLKARVSQNNVVSPNIGISVPFVISVEYRITQPDLPLNVCFQMYNSSGTPICSSANWPSATKGNDRFAGKELGNGLYETTVEIPAYFLNEDTYFLNLVFLKDVNQRLLYAESCLNFTIVDTGEMRKEYTGPWYGVVRPLLDWKTSKF